MLLQNFTLLYVEDDEDMQTYMNSLLCDEVKQLYQAIDGEEGLQLYKDKKPDIILSDISMPKMSGLKMSQAIKELDKHQPILLLSAFEEVESLKEAINIGINGFIAKPIVDINKLLDMLEDIASALQNQLDAKKFKIQQQKVQDQFRLLASVFANSQEGILITDKDNRIIDVNSACLKLTGYTREEVLGNDPRLYSSDKHPPEFYKKMWQSLKKMGHWNGEIWNRKKSGEIYSERLSIDTVTNNKGELQHYVAVFYDMTYIKKHEAELEYIAYNDALTQLPNRLLLHDRMQQALSNARRSEKILAVCYLDLDGFKPVNDSFGHKAGDMVLIEVARRLRNSMRSGDTTARIGGDEFILLMTNFASIPELKKVLDRILMSISQPYVFADEIEEKINSISVSIGVTTFPADDGEADILLRHADQAMYIAKQQGKNQYHFFENIDTCSKEAV
ncbi:MAG: diguanylate cyclase [Proteobacteria bacterium]|nr:diguanylate cyclase [Pseudomonadota bacterium]